MKHRKRWKKTGIVIVSVIAVLAILCGWYILDYYHVVDRDEAMSDTGVVMVTVTDNGYFYDGPGEDTALIFYPGAKVEDIAYAKLLKEIAAQGVDCFLVHMPCNFAFLGMNRADDVMENNHYEHWYLAGHSLGGAMAANYAAENAQKLDGLILLGAYPTKDLSASSLKVLSVYGSEDLVVNRDKIESGRALVPQGYTEYCIKGGNHAQYGNYGEQKGDGTATISAEEQRTITTEQIIGIIEEGEKEDGARN